MEPVYYDLTAAQRLMHTCITEYGMPHVVNIGACIVFQANLDVSLLRRCIQMGQERCSCLCVRFTKPDSQGHILQYLVPPCRQEVPDADLSGYGWEGAVARLESWSAVPFAQADSPMHQFLLVTMPEGYRGFCLRVDHRLMDSCAIIRVAKDILDLYCHLAFHTPRPKPPGPYESALIQDLERERDPERAARAEAFWQSQADLGEPIYTSPKGPSRLEESRNKHKNPGLRAADREMEDLSEGHISFCLEPEQMAPLMEFCRGTHVSMSHLLLMGMRTCLSGLNGGEADITLSSYLSRRSSQTNKTSGGTRTHCYPCRTVLGPDISFQEGIHAIRDLQHGVFRHMDFDPARARQIYIDRYQPPPLTTYESTALTYQPLLMGLGGAVPIPCKGLWLSNGTTIHPLYLTVMPGFLGSGMEFYYKYQRRELSEDDIRHTHQLLTDILSTGTTHPEMKLGQMLEALS